MAAGMLAAEVEAALRGLQDLSPLHVVGAAAATYAALLLWQACNVADLIQYRHLPGPAPLPIIGNLWDVAVRHKKLTYKAYREWHAAYGKDFKWFCGQQAYVVTSDPETIKQVCIKFYKTFPYRALPYPPVRSIYKTMALSQLLWFRVEGWQALKSLFQPLVVHTDGLSHSSKKLSEVVSKAIPLIEARAAGGQSVDMTHFASAFMLGVVGSAAFGVDMDTLNPDPKAQTDSKLMVEASEMFQEGGMALQWFNMVPRALRPLTDRLMVAFPSKAHEKMYKGRDMVISAGMALCKNAIKRLGLEWSDEHGMEASCVNDNSALVWDKFKDRMPAEGSAIDLMAKARRQGDALKTHHMVANSYSIMLGGLDTTSFTLTAMLYFLATHPEAEAAVIAEVDAFGRDKPVTFEDLQGFPFITAVFHETLRLRNPSWINSRLAEEDITVNGLFIPKGTQIHLDIYNMHRDPKHFSDPNAFKPERWMDKGSAENKARHPYAFQPFGCGSRMCLGYKMATMELVQSIAMLYQRFTFELDTSRTKIDDDGLPAVGPGIFLHYDGGVYFHIHPRPAAAEVSAPAAAPAAA